MRNWPKKLFKLIINYVKINSEKSKSDSFHAQMSLLRYSWKICKYSPLELSKMHFFGKFGRMGIFHTSYYTHNLYIFNAA